MSTVQALPGYIQGRENTFSYGDPLPSQVVNLFQDDLALLSDALVQSMGLLFNPATFTTDWKMPCIAGPDQVTIEDNVQFMVGGVLFNTHTMSSRIFQIPDNSTRFIRVNVDPNSGLLQAYQTQPGVIADPLVRNVLAQFTVAPGAETDPAGTGGGPSTSTSMRLIQAVKAGPGSTPVLTLYPNQPTSQASSGTSSSGNAVLPAGMVIPWVSDILPPFGLFLDGSFQSRTVYSDLYGYIGGAEGDIIPANGVDAISVSSGADSITLDRSLPSGYVVRFATTGTLPGGLLAGQDYWVINQQGNTFQVSLTANGTAIDVTNNGSGALLVLSQSFKLPTFEGYHLRGKDNGRGVDTGATNRLARGDGTTGDNVLTIQMDAVLQHEHLIPMEQQGLSQGSAVCYSCWNGVLNRPSTYTTGGTENLVRNRSVNFIITTGLSY
jgi:hypothetical protein